MKITDFGLARVVKDISKTGVDNVKSKIPMTDYVATRWYRAPEVLLGSPYYGTSIDIWSFGCCLAEVYMNKPIFPGSSTLNQLTKILEITGLPTPLELEAISSPLTWEMLESLFVEEQQKSIADLINNDDHDLHDLIAKILVFDPAKRLSIQEIIDHPYFD